MRGTTIAAAFVAAGFASGAAYAAISVFGNTNARICYESALNERSRPSDIRICSEALTDPGTGGRDRVATYVNRGILYVQNGDFVNGIADYDQAIAINDDEPEAYLNKGLALLHQRQSMNEVIALLSAAIEYGTREPALAFYGRGIAHEMSGDIESAYYDIRRAVSLDPEWDVPARDLARFRVVGGEGG